jgi:uncharacterized protein YdaU (DUF1376 family)
MKTKSPAFQFYPADYLSDSNTIAFTAEQDGHYLRLLCLCWLEGSIPIDPRPLLKGGETISDECLNPILRCFRINRKKTALVHPRLDAERCKQIAWREKSSAGGKASALKKRTVSGGNGASRVVTPKSNTSSSFISSSSSLNLKSTQVKKSKYSFTEWDMNLSHTLFEECKKIVPTTKDPDFENWANEFRLMREIEKWHKEDILAILSWMYNEDEFWRGQVRSPQKLRKHYETMYAKRNAAKIGRRSNMNDY